MKRKKPIFTILSIFFSILFLISCSQSPFYYSEIEIPTGSWNMDSAACFKPEIQDTAQKYDILLSVTNSNEYRYSNIWFFMMSSSPDGHLHKDTIEVSLAQEDGKWFGKKSGETFKMDVYFKKQIRFPKAGIYTFEIVQGMRDKELKGIHSIGFKLLQAD